MIENEVIKQCIDHYFEYRSSCGDTELNWFKTLEFDKAIEHAGLAKNKHGNRFDHQRRRRPRTLEKALQALKTNRPKILGAKDFEELIAIVDKATGAIDGIGELYIYDTALRIGANRKIFPARVYLHAGTRVGAQALGVRAHTSSVKLAELPEPFHTIEPYEAEDILCIYKKSLSGKKFIEPSKRGGCCLR